jgi:hypothetical protein
VGVVVAGVLFADPHASTVLAGITGSSAASATAFIAVALLDVGLGIATYYGRNWARVLLMLFCASTILVAFVATVSGGPRPTLGSDLPHVGLGILVLLALTSPGARQYATRGSHLPKRVSGELEERAV